MKESFGERPPTPKNEVMPLSEIEAWASNYLKEADAQLETIRGSLKDLTHRIEEAKPQTIVFLDMSARIFGTPFLKYLNERMGDSAPEVRFYNDQELKGAYLDNRSLDALVEEELGNLKGKKVFFIDETFSSGKGAAALSKARRILGDEIYYAALTKDPDPVFTDEKHQYNISTTQHNKNLEEISQDPHFIIYPNPIKNLFSRVVSRMYVQEWEGKTLSMQLDPEKDETSKKSTIPNANKYVKPPPGLTMDEYLAEASKRIDTVVRTVKEKIYQTLEN